MRMSNSASRYTRENVEIQGHRICVPSATGTNTADPPPAATTVTYRDHGGCYKSQRRGRAVARQDTVAVSLISSLKGKPHVEIRAVSRNLDILRSNSQNRYHPCLRARFPSISLSLRPFSPRRANKIHDRRIIYRCFVTMSHLFAFNVDVLRVSFLQRSNKRLDLRRDRLTFLARECYIAPLLIPKRRCEEASPIRKDDTLAN